MKILFKIISAFLYFTFVSPVQMYYIYDGTPNVGFVSVDNGIGTYMKTGYSVGKASSKQFTATYSNPKFQKINNEHVVDSHFKVRKTPSKRYTIPAVDDTGRLITYETNEGKNKAQRIVEEYRNTEAPQQSQQNQHQQKTITAGQQDKQNKRGDYGSKPIEAATHTQSSNNQQLPPIRPKAVNVDYSSKSIRQRNQDLGRNQRNQDLGRGQRQNEAGRSQINQDGVYDSKTTYMNVRKAPISVDPQTVILNSNHQLTSLSVISSDKRQRLPTSMMMDKTLQKASGLTSDHNKQVMTRVLDDMTKTISDRRHSKGEYVNKNLEDHLDTIYEKSKRSVIAENLRKYIGKEKIGKELRNQHKQITALARIGSHEETLEDDTPYAVFYRMNPESLDRQDRYMIPRSMDDNGSGDFNSKEKRVNTAFPEDTEKSSNAGGINFQLKKLKNFSSYMNY